MALRYDTVTFLSDYGLVDEFVGVVHSVVRSIAPDVHVLDLTHQVPAYDVRAGGLTLARSAGYLCPGVVLAVVDPGVGTERRAIAVEVGDGMSVLVGPDNGLLAPAVAMCGGATRAVELTNPEYQLAAPGPTFAGRDIFAPAAAHLCLGVPLTDLGPTVDPVSLVPGLLPVTREEDGELLAEVLWVDGYGNAQLNVDPEEIERFGDRVRIRFGDETRTARVVENFGSLGPHDIGLMVDSYGLVAVVVDRRSAASDLGLGPGSAVQLSGFDDEDDEDGYGAAGAGVVTPVELGRRSGDRRDEEER
jgi:S-adenosylmethionine hydrolase